MKTTIKKIQKNELVGLVEVIEVKKIVGDGTESNPVHTECEYWTTDGKYIGSLENE